MPPKIRELKARLRKAGFECRQGKGDHTIWSHPDLPDKINVSGNDGSDARKYQERMIEQIIKKLEEQN